MLREGSYRKAFLLALFFHVVLGVLLWIDSTTSQPVLVKEAKNEIGEITSEDNAGKPPVEIVKAVSVNTEEVMNTVNRLKEERVKQLKAEQSKQEALKKQAESARKERLLEQQRLTKLKEEAAKLDALRKKRLEEEQASLKRLALQKEQEAKRLQALKEKQLQESKKLAELKKKEAEEAKIKAKEAAELATQQEAFRQEALQDAAKKAKMAGEVDKYKALILNAISQRWILPENIDKSLSSQFRIRLAPDGAVLQINLTRSSGDSILDRSAERAIYKASPLPVPSDPALFELFRDISLTVRPENIRG